MIFAREFAVRLLDRIRIGGALDTEDRVVVFVFHWIELPLTLRAICRRSQRAHRTLNATSQPIIGLCGG